MYLIILYHVHIKHSKSLIADATFKFNELKWDLLLHHHYIYKKYLQKNGFQAF